MSRYRFCRPEWHSEYHDRVSQTRLSVMPGRPAA